MTAHIGAAAEPAPISTAAATAPAPISWVLGAGGLLGSSVAAALSERGPLWAPARPIPWDGPARSALAEAAQAFRDQAGGDPWRVAWCAGAGVTSSTARDLQREAAAFGALLDALSAGGSDWLARGSLFLASSAGGVYAGSTGAPFTEATPPAPLAPYGAAKLGLERAAAEWAGADGAAVLIGRISNLYGPGQNLGKAQGLISQICRAHLLREPISIWAPLDSARDYLYAPDCARMIAEGLDLLAGERRAGAAGVRTKIFASGQGATVGFLIAELRRIVKHPPRVVFASSVATRFQPRDLRLRSVVWPQIDRLARTPLPVGIKRVAQDLLAALQAARLR